MQRAILAALARAGSLTNLATCRNAWICGATAPAAAAAASGAGPAAISSSRSFAAAAAGTSSSSGSGSSGGVRMAEQPQKKARVEYMHTKEASTHLGDLGRDVDGGGQIHNS